MTISRNPHPPLPIRTREGPSNMESNDAPAPSASPTTTTMGTPLMTPMEGSEYEPSVVEAEAEVKLDVLPLPGKDGLILKVQPPREPSGVSLDYHAPCDIVLVIDVSGSMGVAALPPPTAPGQQSERNGLSVLDLVKHASHTIQATLNEGDRLGIVTFDTHAKVLQKLSVMDDAGKVSTTQNIDGMSPGHTTNLWQGILEGMRLIDERDSNGRVPVLMVLTDGEPNEGDPPGGYIPRLKSKKIPAPIHTFGFGFNLQSGLLKSISECSGGDYAFIPDPSMLGTIFIHAVANIQATFAKAASVTINYPHEVELLVATGESLGHHRRSEHWSASKSLTIPLGSVQYGQSKDIVLRYVDKDGNAVVLTDAQADSLSVDVTLDYAPLSGGEKTMAAQRSLTPAPAGDLPLVEAAYHVSRAMICGFLSTLFPITGRPQEHVAVSWGQLDSTFKARLEELKASLPTRGFPNDENCKSLVADLEGPQPQGQISLALQTEWFWGRWGKHYLPSILNAHTRQICNSFKDEGPLRYGVDSPLFERCRDCLNDAFDNIEPPPPSLLQPSGHSYRAVLPSHVQQTIPSGPPPRYTPTATLSRIDFDSPVSMMQTSYRTRANPCFSASTTVLLADDGGAGEKLLVRMSRLRAGMKVETPLGPRAVARVLRTKVKNEPMIRLAKDVLATEWHPVLWPKEGWEHPKELHDRQLHDTTAVRYSGHIYSVLLCPDTQPDAHAVMLGGRVWGVTLGHGLVEYEEAKEKGGVCDYDARVHAFFGDYARVAREIERLRPGPGGVALCGGLRRAHPTGRAIGFVKPSARASGGGRRVGGGVVAGRAAARRTTSREVTADRLFEGRVVIVLLEK